MRENDDSARVRGYGQVASEIHISSVDEDASLDDLLGVCRHADGYEW